MDALNSEIELEMNELKDQLDQAANEAAEQQALRLQGNIIIWKPIFIFFL